MGGNGGGEANGSNLGYVADCGLSSFVNIAAGGNAGGHAVGNNLSYVADCGIPAFSNIALGSSGDGSIMCISGCFTFISCDATITPAGPFCPGDSAVNLTAVDTGGVWSGIGITDTILATFDPAIAGIGTHLITYTITGICDTIDTMNVVVVNFFDATITPAGPFCPGTPAIILTAVDNGGTWFGTGIIDGIKGAFDPVVAGAGTHLITYTIAGSCGGQDTINLEVQPCAIFIPNTFTPNVDGMNDILYVRGSGIGRIQLFIYNRWGTKVFETNDINQGWDGTLKGKKLNPGVFAYYAEGEFTDGNTFYEKGNITLIR